MIPEYYFKTWYLGIYTNIWGTDREKRQRLEKAVDGIRERFGYNSILPCSVLGNDLGIDDKEG